MTHEIRLLVILAALPMVPALGPADATVRDGGADDAQRPGASFTFEGRCQLRMFTINRGKLGEFTQAWLAGVVPLRLQHGFTVPAAWTVPNSNQFMWVLCYKGAESFESKDSAYYASSERHTLAPDPREFIARAEQGFIDPVIPRPLAGTRK